MRIEVIERDSANLIFLGEADDFLEANNYDDEIEEFLNCLDTEDVGTVKSYFANQGMEYTVEKLEEDMEEE